MSLAEKAGQHYGHPERLTALLGYRVPAHVVFFIELERRHVWLAGVTTILTAVGSFGRLATWPCPSTMVVAASSS
jgi:hypothetical protein